MNHKTENNSQSIQEYIKHKGQFSKFAGIVEQ